MRTYLKMQKNNNLIEVSEDLLSIPPLISRLVRRKLNEIAIPNLDFNITPLQYEVMLLLEKEGTLCVSEIGERLHITKAQMTKLISKLVALNMVEKKVHPSDRRTINISLRGPARNKLKENKVIIIRAIQDILLLLTDKDMEMLSFSLHNIRDIFIKTQ
jgi:DNA-binding MarR family transcriptional regulator